MRELVRKQEEFRRDVDFEEKLLPSGYWKYIFRYNLIGSAGAACFIFHLLTQEPDELDDFVNGRWEGFEITPIDMVTPSGGCVMASDLGFHSRTPKAEWWVHHEYCQVLGGECWFNADTLPAQELFNKFLQTRDVETIWKELEEVYQSETKEES